MTSSASAARTLIATAAIAFSAALLAGCGSSSSPAAGPSAGSNRPATTPDSSVNPGGPDQTVNPTATATPTAAGAPACATSALHVAVPASGGNAAAGSSYYPVQFANTSSSPCTLYGYPGVSFVTAMGGSQIGIPATRNPALAARLVTLSPGETVHAELQVADAQNYPPTDCDLVTAHWLKIYPPNQTAPVYVSFTAQTCSKPKTILSVQTVQTGTSGA
jgi:Protein of unknown function (DUF4232)